MPQKYCMTKTHTYRMKHHHPPETTLHNITKMNIYKNITASEHERRVTSPVRRGTQSRFHSPMLLSIIIFAGASHFHRANWHQTKQSRGSKNCIKVKQINIKKSIPYQKYMMDAGVVHHNPSRKNVDVYSAKYYSSVEKVRIWSEKWSQHLTQGVQWCSHSSLLMTELTSAFAPQWLWRVCWLEIYFLALVFLVFFR